MVTESASRLDRQVAAGTAPLRSPEWTGPTTSAMVSSASAIAGGTSLLIAWQLKDKCVLIVGGGDVASGRLEFVLAADARVVLVSPRNGLHPVTERLIHSSERITYHDRLFNGPDDLVDVDMVLTAIDDVESSRQICAMCRTLKIPINVADIPPSCDFYFGSQIRKGQLQIIISTNGQSPKLANLIRKRIEENLPENVDQAIANVGLLRMKLRERAPGVGGELGKRRMGWMVRVCTDWQMDDLAQLDEPMIKRLLDEGWENNRVPTIQDLGGKSQRVPRHWQIPPALVTSAAGFILGAACTALILLPRRRSV